MAIVHRLFGLAVAALALAPAACVKSTGAPKALAAKTDVSRTLPGTRDIVTQRVLGAELQPAAAWSLHDQGEQEDDGLVDARFARAATGVKLLGSSDAATLAGASELYFFDFGAQGVDVTVYPQGLRVAASGGRYSLTPGHDER